MIYDLDCEPSAELVGEPIDDPAANGAVASTYAIVRTGYWTAGVEAIHEGAETNEEVDCEIVVVRFGSDMGNRFTAKLVQLGRKGLEIE
jgi:hypothetical protein